MRSILHPDSGQLKSLIENFLALFGLLSFKTLDILGMTSPYLSIKIKSFILISFRSISS